MNPSNLERIATALEQIVLQMKALNLAASRIADVLAPSPTELIGTPYIAKRLGQTTVWVAEMARKGIIPAGCIAVGTGKGKPWKFKRSEIDKWLQTR